jgi:non-ribosomal peptide synthase protein (TIGR01720 family)
VLVEIWSELLGVEHVGIHDDFFELGGDSILSIQVVARANQAGIRFRPAQLFEYKTIAEIAAVASSAPAVLVEQGILTGTVPLTPIQHWFFEQDLCDPHHYTQSALIEMPSSVDFAKLRTAVDRVVTHHDALRLRFSRSESGWQQHFSGGNDSVMIERLDMSLWREEEQDSVFTKRAAQLQSSLNFTEGPLVRAALFEVGMSKPTYLLLVVHHLIIDNVSWAILLEDLWTVYEQLINRREIRLAPKTTSIQRWAILLEEYAQSVAFEEKREYWLTLSAVKDCGLPRDYPDGVNVGSSADTILVALGTEETHSLLYEIPKTHRAQINEILLLALCQTFSHWSGQNGLLVDVEGHGREEIVGDVDLSRTVGWFTTVFPIFLRAPIGDDLGTALGSIKEQLRQVPDRGIGYGLIRYLSRNLDLRDEQKVLARPEVAFNYLGQLGEIGSSRWKRLSTLTGPNLGPHNRRPILLEIDGGVVEGRLELTWTYSNNIHRRSTIATLAEQFTGAVRRVIKYCHGPAEVGYLPSDFAKARLTQAELDNLLAKLR